jgi:hypothetical protein
MALGSRWARPRATIALLVLLAGGAGGCGYALQCARPAYGKADPASPALRVVYLGTGGVIVARGSDVLLTAPLYSNPTAGELALQDLASDHERIDAYLARYEDELSRVSMILLGHAHYDHLMDVPHVMKRWVTRPDVPVYGNNAMREILAALQPPSLRERLVSVEGRIGEYIDVPNTRIRVWPIGSEHSPQISIVKILGVEVFPPVQLWRGEPEQDLPALPKRAGQWSQGTVLAYVIDFRDAQGDVDYRVYYQDSPTRRPYGFPDMSKLGDHRVDLAILCVGGTEADDEFKANPRPIIEDLKPVHVLGIHWEDFLNPRRLPLPAEASGASAPPVEEFRRVPSANPGKWLRRATSASSRPLDVVLPCPDTWSDLSPTVGGQPGQWASPPWQSAVGCSEVRR